MAPRYWFRAKRYGWGWGLPLTWEGWAILAVFLASILGASLLFPPARATYEFAISLAVLLLLLGLVCWTKGEPARWRWGGDDASRR